MVPILWVDNDVHYLRPQVQNLLDEKIPVEVESKIDGAREEVINGHKSYRGVILDMMMPPGDYYASSNHKGGFFTGLLFVQEMSDLGLLPKLKVVVLTNFQDQDAINAIEAFGIQYADKYDYRGMKIIDLVEDCFR